MILERVPLRARSKEFIQELRSFEELRFRYDESIDLVYVAFDELRA